MARKKKSKAGRPRKTVVVKKVARKSRKKVVKEVVVVTKLADGLGNVIREMYGFPTNKQAVSFIAETESKFAGSGISFDWLLGNPVK